MRILCKDILNTAVKTSISIKALTRAKALVALSPSRALTNVLNGSITVRGRCEVEKNNYASIITPLAIVQRAETRVFGITLQCSPTKASTDFDDISID